MIIARVVKIMVLVMMNTHIYTWDGEKLLQTAGGPIRLRSMCVVRKVLSTFYFHYHGKNGSALRATMVGSGSLQSYHGWKW